MQNEKNKPINSQFLNIILLKMFIYAFKGIYLMCIKFLKF